MTLEMQIKTEATRLGFNFCGITQPSRPLHYDTYLHWLAEGCHAGMTYLARPGALQKRADPHELLPGCQSILCLGMRYAPPRTSEPSESRPPLGYIAAYALSPDYHQEIAQRLENLIQEIKAMVDIPVQAKACVDTAPIMEKDYAQQAGLGWIGRNTCLINPMVGSYCFLAEVLLNLPLEPDQPYIEDGCANCTCCIDACPTNAIRPDRTIDARRCLSYLTIEHRGPIPEDLRPLMGKRIFGCDTCQVVCPYNQARNLDEHALTLTPILNPRPDLLESLLLSEDAFKKKYQQTALMRARYQGFRRNVAIALGNNPIPAAKPLLQDLSENDPDPLIRDACLWALTHYDSVA